MLTTSERADSDAVQARAALDKMRTMQGLALSAGLDVADLPETAITLLKDAADGRPIDPARLEHALAAADRVQQAAGWGWLHWQWQRRGMNRAAET
jgi:hypothetical protein